MDKKSYGNILIYDVAYKTTYSAKLLHIIFDMVDGYVRKYDRTKYHFILIKKMRKFLTELEILGS